MSAINQDFVDKANEADISDELFASMLAQSAEAFRKYSSTLSDVEKQMIGQWRGIPPKLSTWAFYRVGSKASSSSQGLAYLMRQQGWIDAPRGVHLAGFEVFDGSDGANALVLCAPQETYKRQKAIELAAQQKKSIKDELEKFDNLEASLSSMGLAIDSLDVKHGADTLDNVADNATTDRARLRNKRP